MDELVDILDADGNFTGETKMKSAAHSNGLFHPTVHVWCYTRNGLILIQQRAKNKDTYPKLWDVSVAGHVGAGEDLLTSAIREVSEEIGLTIRSSDLQKIGIFKAEHIHGSHFIDREFHHTFLYELKIPLEQLKKQQDEVDDLALIPITQFAEETWGMANLKKYVPHGQTYYKAIIKAIKEQL